MSFLTLHQSLKTLSISNFCIFLKYANTHKLEKTGLLNYKILQKNEGMIFKKCKIFHTFGMRFPISVFILNRAKTLIAPPKIVKPNHIFICPRKTYYVIEAHKAHSNFEGEFPFPYKILILNCIISKAIFCLIKFLPLLCLVVSILLTCSSSFAESNSINLNLNNTRTIHLEQAPQSIQIDDPEILELERIGISNSIKIIPKQPGKTHLTFQYLEGNDETILINVTFANNAAEEAINESEKLKNLDEYKFENSIRSIKKMTGIEYTLNAGKIFLLGQVNTIEKFKEIAKIIAVYPQGFFPSFEINASILNRVLDFMNTDIRSMGDHNLVIIKRGDHILLKGVHTSESQKDKIWTYLSAVLPNLIDATNVFFGESSLVQIHFEFFEVGQGFKKNIGFKYPNLGSDAVGFMMNPDPTAKPSFQITPFSVFFQALFMRNYVREIARPVIITRSGEKATFLAGGEVPIPSVVTSASTTNSSVTFKSVGILFDVTPRVSDDGTIWIKLNAEYSQINEALSYQNTPGFNSRKISTNIILKEGSAAVISGLIQNTELKKSENIPQLHSLPIIGDLFKSRQNGKQSTELWIAISAVQKKSL